MCTSMEVEYSCGHRKNTGSVKKDKKDGDHIEVQERYIMRALAMCSSCTRKAEAEAKESITAGEQDQALKNAGK
jgi:hypothetical protein